VSEQRKILITIIEKLLLIANADQKKEPFIKSLQVENNFNAGPLQSHRSSSLSKPAQNNSFIGQT
jgi:hypothetical protein